MLKIDYTNITFPDLPEGWEWHTVSCCVNARKYTEPHDSFVEWVTTEPTKLTVYFDSDKDVVRGMGIAPIEVIQAVLQVAEQIKQQVAE